MVSRGGCTSALTSDIEHLPTNFRNIGKVYFVSWFERFQSHVDCPVVLGHAKAASHGRRVSCIGEDITHFTDTWKNKTRISRVPSSPWKTHFKFVTSS